MKIIIKTTFGDQELPPDQADKILDAIDVPDDVRRLGLPLLVCKEMIEDINRRILFTEMFMNNPPMPDIDEESGKIWQGLMNEVKKFDAWWRSCGFIPAADYKKVREGMSKYDDYCVDNLTEILLAT
jgi:hypothetical protein